MFPLVSVRGTPSECGLQYGSITRGLLCKQIEFYFDLWKRLWGAQRTNVLEQCHKLIPIIGEYDADILEELEGIAKGAEVSLEEVVALNARYELNWACSLVPTAESQPCTILAALPEVTKSGHTLMGENWDFRPRVHDCLIVLEIRQRGKPSIMTITEAGQIGVMGMNSAGLGLCGNGLVSSLDSFNESRLPIWLLKRSVLNAGSFSDAIKAVMNTKVGVSLNFLIGHQAGEVIDLEVTPKDVGFLHAEDGILAHSNNFLALANRPDILDVMKTTLPDTLFRFERARHLLAKDHGHIDIGSFQRVFRDHFSYPNSICRHSDPRQDETRQLATIQSLIMDLENRTLFVAEGPPCENEYIKLHLRE